MKRKVTLQAVAAMGAVVASIALAGCAGKKITDDQMTQLQERKREIASLENALQQNTAERVAAERRIAGRAGAGPKMQRR